MSATLKAILRDKLGSRFARRLRAQGRIPASIQGEHRDNVDFSIDEVEFLTARRHHEHLFDIEFDGRAAETAVVRELAWDAFGDEIVHVEFRRVVRGQKTRIEVPLEFLGHPKGGVLNHSVTHVTVMALPSQIPDVIEVKVDGLDLGQAIYARDLELPDGVDLAIEPGLRVANVTTVREEPAAPAPGAEGAEGAAAPAATPPAS